MKALALSAALIGLAVTPAVAKTKITETFTNDGRVQRTAEIHYGDLDLTNDMGTRTLKRRIEYAVRSVCSPAPRGSMNDAVDYRGCISEARSSGQKAMVTLIARAERGERFAASASIVMAN